MLEKMLEFWPFLVLIPAIVGVGSYGFYKHAIKHTDGSDDIQTADETQKGLMSSTHVTDLDGFPDELKNLITAEIQQLENINAILISAAQWGYLGSSVAGGGALMALALGAANLKMFVNAAGAAPEWVVGMKIGAFSIDTATATGTQAVAGVGFKPSHVIFLALINVTSQASIGIDDGTTAQSLADYTAITADTWSTDPFSIVLIQGAGNKYTGKISSLDANGFTISWTKTGAKTGTAKIYYLALR